MKRKELKIDPAPGDLRIVTDFVNTVDRKRGVDLWSSSEALATWLAGKGLLPVGTELSDADLERAVAVREGLRALVCAHNGAGAQLSAVREFDRAVAAAALRARFDDEGVISFEPMTSGIDAALARLMSFIEEARRLGHWRRLKGCANDACRKAFYDHSRNRSGKWCSMRRCGNEINSKRYRRRYKQIHGEWPRGGWREAYP